MELKKVKEIKTMLTKEKIEKIKENPINELAKIVEFAGYNAGSREILNKRRPQENFSMLIKACNSFIGLTEEEKREVRELKEILIDLKSLLPQNTFNELRYLNLVQKVNNSLYELAEQNKILEDIKDGEKWLKHYEEVKIYHSNYEEAQNELDKFIFENLV